MVNRWAPLLLLFLLNLCWCNVASAEVSTPAVETSDIGAYASDKKSAQLDTRDKAISKYDACLLDKMRSAGDEIAVSELRESCEKIAQLEKSQAQSAVELGEESAVTKRLIAEEKALDNPFEISSYRRNYVLFASYNAYPNTDVWNVDHPEQDINDVEVKFQLSFKALIAKGVLGGNLWGAYSQQSWWQLYAQESSPFRETNYEPELMLRWDTDLRALGFNMRVWNFGFNHESNGRSGEFSRSWNRIMAQAVFDRGNFLVVPRVWWRIPEPEETDDNRDIDDYLGYGDIAIAYKWGANLFSTTIKGNLLRDQARMGLQLEWTFPVADRFKGYVQYYDGYGESLIDYNHRTQRIGVGVLLNDFI